MKNRIAIIGLGIIGGATYEDMIEYFTIHNVDAKLFGVDIKKEVLNKYNEKYGKSPLFGGLTKKIPSNMDVYIISVYSPEQIEDVFNKIPKKHAPLIIVESTIPPNLCKKLLNIKENAKLALFPHRFNPNDPEHRIFNLNRILGGADKESEKAALDFYSQFMDKKLITIVPYFVVALSKPAENAYRFIEIVVAEEWKSECDRLGIDFNELRNAMNTKWNINLKEARDGIGGMCLSKDMGFMKKFFNKSKIIDVAINADKEYKKKYGKI